MGAPAFVPRLTALSRVSSSYWASQIAFAIRSKSLAAIRLHLRKAAEPTVAAHSASSAAGRPPSNPHLIPHANRPSANKRPPSSRTPRQRSDTDCPRHGSERQPRKSASDPRRGIATRGGASRSVSLRPRAATCPSTSGMISVVVEPTSIKQSRARLSQTGTRIGQAHANCSPPPAAARSRASASRNKPPIDKIHPHVATTGRLLNGRQEYAERPPPCC